MKSLVLSVMFLVSVSLLAAQNNSTEQAPMPVDQEPHHAVVLKNDSVIVMHVVIPEGGTTFYHIHAHDRAAVELSTATISQQNLHEPEGPATPTKPGDVSAPTLGAAPTIHRVHNLGPGTFEVLDVEFLQRPKNPISEAAAPVAVQNPSARIYKWVLAPGASSPMHSHTHPYLILAVTAMPLKMTAPDGQSMTHEVKAGDFHWIDGKATHSLTNEGTAVGQIVEIELK
ncbi:MAG TPA: cupin domain-containing protein [Verrucomicrobiae bacterium]|nr:cupin domain-containing protein [Verrucomicrobiae bacterium]